MKRLIKNIVTKEEAEWIIDNKNNLSFDNKIIAKILSKLEEYMDKKVSLDERTHLRVEEATKERCHHPWHVDTGSLNHMSWCIYGVSILLNTDFEGGEFSYGIKESKDTNIVTEIIRPDNHYLSAALHSSDVWHCRHKVSKGTRKVLLMFFPEKNAQ